MFPKSLRWRLSLTYAGIALLTALVLGGVLLSTLYDHYRQLEREYLAAQVIDLQLMATAILNTDQPNPIIQDALKKNAFYAQTQIQVIDADAVVRFDSGMPNELKIIDFVTLPEAAAGSSGWHAITGGDAALVVNGQNLFVGSLSGVTIVDASFDHDPFIRIAEYPVTSTIVELVPPATNDDLYADAEVITVESSPGPVPPGNFAATTTVQGDYYVDLGQPVVYTSALPVGGYLPNTNLAEIDTLSHRSSVHYRAPITDLNGVTLGYLELSNGPSFGDGITRRVGQGWGLSSVVAVILAAGGGLGISRRMSTPLVQLTDVTESMAAGNLTVRANPGASGEIGQLAASFNHMAEQVEKTIHALRRFVADAAHELHTPLTALRADLELVFTGETLTARQHDLIQRAQQHADRLETLTDGLLELSHLEAQSQAPTPKRVDLAALIRHCSEIYASWAEQADLTLTLDLPSEPVQLAVDAQRIERVLQNLVENAIKFTPSGGAVSIALRHADNGVELAVSDTGIGIHPTDLPLVFERFHRGQNAATHPGNGLGLAIVRQIVRSYGGSISAHNTPTGTCFLARLPRK